MEWTAPMMHMHRGEFSGEMMKGLISDHYETVLSPLLTRPGHVPHENRDMSGQGWSKRPIAPIENDKTSGGGKVGPKDD